MSGGSFDYICFKEIHELFNFQDDIQNMADELAKLGYADDAAKETQTLLLELRSYMNRINTKLERLQPVWKAVEWWMSLDWDEKKIKESLNQYRRND